MKKMTLFFLLLTLMVTACSTATPTAAPSPVAAASAAVIAEGRLLPDENLALNFNGRGKVAEILASEGDTVKAGDVLARLADRVQAEASLASANLELTSTQQAYDTLIRSAGQSRAKALQTYLNAQMARAEAERALEAHDGDAYNQRLDTARIEVSTKKDQLKTAQEDFDKKKDLGIDNEARKAAKTALDNAMEAYNETVRALTALENEAVNFQAAVDAAVGAQAEAKRAYDNTASGPDADQLTLVEARLSNAKAQVAAAELALDSYVIVAPFDGVVAKVGIKVGEIVGPEKNAFILADFSRWVIETTDLTEMDVVKISQGQAVEITADALEEKMTGTVVSISQTYATQAGDIIYTVKIGVNDVPALARWGMTVEIVFQP